MLVNLYMKGSNKYLVMVSLVYLLF